VSSELVKFCDSNREKISVHFQVNTNPMISQVGYLQVVGEFSHFHMIRFTYSTPASLSSA
jgi:hypothetical protein